MAAKKYLSLEEAAQFLGVRSDEVIRLRERGELRGFADRGTWKFKSDDVEEAKRRRQPDSSPDVPLMSDDSALDVDVKTSRDAASDSDVRLMAGADLRTSLTGSSHDMPVIKTGKGSDSDVRLVGAAGLKPLKGSDSDVKLIKPKGSDSDVKLSDSDSDVRLTGVAGPRSPADSDSDVRLAPPAGSDSDVRLAKPGSDSDVKLVDSSAMSDDPSDFDASDSVLLDAESGFSLEPGSGIVMGGDSGVRLSADSGLRLGGDSGIQLSSPADSGILLERAGDSGFRPGDDDSPAFKFAGDSGLKFGEGPKSSPRPGKKPSQSLTDDEIEMRPPMLFEGEDDSRTDPDVPMLMDEDEEETLMPKGLDRTNAETSVILFDDAEDSGTAETVLRKRGGAGRTAATEEFEAESADDLDIDDEELLADDSDLDAMEVFESEDSDFDDSFSEGASAADISAFRGKIAVPIDQEWGTGAVVGLGFSTLAMAVGVIVAVDLLRSVWGAGGAVYPGELVGVLGGFFK